MFWSQNNNKICETTLELESITSSDDLITHAAVASDTRCTYPFCNDDIRPASADCSVAKCMWVALATSSKQLQLVQLGLAWGLSPEATRGPAAAGQVLNPTLRGKQVAITSWLPSNGSDSPLDQPMTEISCLEFIPAAYDPMNKAWLLPFILTVRSFVPTPDTPYNQEAQSIIDRWEVTSDQSQTLHPAFENLGSRRNSVGAAPSVSTLIPSQRLASALTCGVAAGSQVEEIGSSCREQSHYRHELGAVEYGYMLHL